MTIPVWVEQQGGVFAASVCGAPGVRALADSREKAVAGLRAELEARMSAGELLLMDVEPKDLSSLAGRYANDDVSRRAWEDLVAEAYRLRDEEKAREFPE